MKKREAPVFLCLRKAKNNKNFKMTEKLKVFSAFIFLQNTVYYPHGPFDQYFHARGISVDLVQ